MNATSTLRYAGGLLVLVAAGVIVLVLLGTFDPQPTGELVWQADPVAVRIGSGEEQLLWQETPRLNEILSVRLEAASNRMVDAAYGLAVGNEGYHLAVVVAPTGYVSIWQARDREREMLLPWQTWPHVRQEGNELWVDVFANKTRIWINRELLWEGELARSPEMVGIFGQSSNGDVAIDVRRLELFQDAAE